MKKQLILSLSLLSLLTVVLLNCKKKEDPTPGGSNTGGNNTSLTISAVNPTSGTAGTKVVITGTGFSANLSANTVKFGSISAILDSASATRLVTKVPKDATTGKITVEAGGKTATSSSDFSITQAPPTFSGTGSGANVPVTVTTTTASIATIIDKEGSKSIIQHGHVWSSTKSDPTLRVAAAEGKTELGTIPANATFPYKFMSDLKDLDPATTYNVRAYVKTNEGTTYGPVSQVQSKKPCLLATYNQFGNLIYDAQYRLTSFRFAVPNSLPSINTLIYNADGYLVKQEISINGNLSTELYEYEKGRLSKIEHQYGTIGYTYDAQGKIVKETTTSGDVTTDYVYTDGVLKIVIANKGATYTIKDGQITKRDNGSGNYTTYEYDTKGNQTKLVSFTADKQTLQFDYSYDDKPNYVLSFFSFKGWLPEQIRKGGFFLSLSLSNNSYNNWTERKYQSATSKETVKRVYTYTKNRISSYTETTTDTVNGSNYTLNRTYNYTGDCDN